MSARVDRIIAFYEGLRPDTVADLRALYAPAARFKDPHNEVVGHAAIEGIFAHMFEQVGNPRFKVTGCIESDRRAALEWIFSFVSSGRLIEVRGSSVLDFDDDGCVSVHRDYWDPAEELYEKLPLIGIAFRWLRRRMSATH